MTPTREINITIKLSEKDNLVLETAAGAIEKSPDELFNEFFAPQVQAMMKATIDALEREIARLPPIAKRALQSRGLAKEAWQNISNPKGRR